MKKPYRILCLAAVAALCACLLGGCVKTEMKKESRMGFALDTVISLTAYTDRPELLEKALEECAAYEKMLSRTAEGSEVWRINHAEGKPVTVSDETAEILRTAVRVSELSGGAFDVTIAPVSTLWDFTSGEAVLPDAEEIARAARRVDYRKIQIEGNQVTLPEGMMIDLGGIAKGYIADAVKESLRKQGIGRAILSFGGNVVTIGEKAPNTPWNVGIQDIDKPSGTTMLVAHNFGGSTVTSGIYERGFEKDGVWYHHILDSRTGWPVQNELASVTIFSESSMWGDALATAAFALGTEEGIRLIEGIEGTEALFIARDRSAVGTSGIARYMAEGSEVAARTEKPPEPGPEAAEEAPLMSRVTEADQAKGYVLVQEGESVGFLPLPEKGTATRVISREQPDGTAWRNVIVLTPEGFRVTEANCEGQDCIGQGEVTLENMRDRALWNMVICAPHRLSLSLMTPEEARSFSHSLR